MTQSPSPPWNITTKAIVAVSALALFCLLVWVFSGLLQQVVLAALLAYLLHPLISLIDRRTPLNRVSIVLLVYLALALIVVATFSLVGVTTFQQMVDLSGRLPGWFEDAIAQLQELMEQLPGSAYGWPADSSCCRSPAPTARLGRGARSGFRPNPADFQPRGQPRRRRRHRHCGRSWSTRSHFHGLHLHCHRHSTDWRHDRQCGPQARLSPGC